MILITESFEIRAYAAEYLLGKKDDDQVEKQAKSVSGENAPDRKIRLCAEYCLCAQYS
ncbi:MAG: hypothetical protein WCG78_04620 [Candidatus Omnitrophota bacterium]